MARTKQQRIIEVRQLPNVFTIKNENILNELNIYWGNQNPIILEIGCGQGDYSNSLAKDFPGKNFLGIDIKGARIYTAAKKALENSMTNVCFYLGNVEILLQQFQPQSIEQIYIPFPDPHVKRKNENRRLISDDFFVLYKKVIMRNGTIQLKTDNLKIYEEALKSIKNNSGKILFASEKVDIENYTSKSDYIITKYEKHYLEEGRVIKLIQFGF